MSRFVGKEDFLQMTTPLRTDGCRIACGQRRATGSPFLVSETGWGISKVSYFPAVSQLLRTGARFNRYYWAPLSRFGARQHSRLFELARR